MSGIISLTLGVVVLSSVFITTVKSANQNATCFYSNGTAYGCTWSTGEIALWGLLGIAGIAGMVFGVLNVFGLA